MQLIQRNSRRNTAAFTLIEVAIAMAVIGIVVVALYSGFSYGFSVIKLSREDLRATQIMVEKMETIRLYRWEQINTSGFIPATFTNYYDPQGAKHGAGGVVYQGTIEISPASLDPQPAYDSHLRLVTVQLKWTSSGVPRTREMSTLVSRYGLQNYIY